MNGFLLIDKQRGETSFDVVRRVRKELGVKKVGHSGTLDKLASGLLLLAVGKGTKLLEYLIGCDKEYFVTAKFGFVSDTYDEDGEVEAVSDEEFSREDVLAAMEAFKGVIEQVPPKYSALKVGGKRASDIVRGGGEVELKARKIEIKEFEIVDFDWPQVSFRVECTAGTYIRSLIFDLGQKLGCGAYVKDLRRTRVGDFSIDDVLSKKIDQNLISLEEVAKTMPAIELSDEDFDGLADGKVLLGKKIEQDCPTMAFYKDKLVGVVENSADGRGIKYKKMI